MNSMEYYYVPLLYNDNNIDDEGLEQLWGGNDDTSSESSPKTDADIAVELSVEPFVAHMKPAAFSSKKKGKRWAKVEAR